MAAHRTHHPLCKHCNRTRAEVTRLSARGLCEACAIERETENAVQLAHHEGPAYRRWLHAYAQAALRLTGEVVSPVRNIDTD